MTGRARSSKEVLTPEAASERAARQVLEGLRTMIVSEIAKRTTEGEYYDQATSPLGRRRHLELARKGKFPSITEGRKILVTKSDMHAYLEREGLARGARIDDDDVDGIIETITGGSTK